MITKGIIEANVNGLSPDYSSLDTKYIVRLPIFEGTGKSSDATVKAICAVPTGTTPDYQPGDVVFVTFEDNCFNHPVIIGKLYTGDKGNAKTFSEIVVTDMASLPLDTTIGNVPFSEIVDQLNNISPAGAATWGQITGTLSNQTDLQNALNNKQDIINQYIASASVSGNTLFITDKDGNILTYTPSAAATAWGDIEGTLSDQTDLQEALDSKLELYEVQPTDIESIEGTLVTFTKDLSDKITSGKYIFKFNSNLFEPEPDPDNYTEMIIKPAFNMQSDWIGEDVKLYTYETVIDFFDTNVVTYRFIYNEQLDRVVADTEQSISYSPIPATIQAGYNSIQLNTGDVQMGDEVHFATINNETIVGVVSGTNINTPNDYHQPRFSSGLGIASSSNVSEIYIPYATSSTYGVLKDIYYPSSNPSNYASVGYVDNTAYLAGSVAYASAVTYVDNKLTSYATQNWVNTEIYIQGSAIYAQAVSDAESYTKNYISGAYNSAFWTSIQIGSISRAIPAPFNGALNLSLDGYAIGTYYPSNGATINFDLSTSGYAKVVANPAAPTTSTLESVAINGVNYALPGVVGTYVPYSGANKTVNLNSQALINVDNLTARGFYIYGTSYAGIDYNNSISEMTVGNYHGDMNIYADGSLTLSTASNNNIVLLPSGKAYYGGTAASQQIAVVGQIPQDYIPLTGTNSLAGNIIPSVSNGYSYTLGGSNREFNAIFVRNIYGAASEGLDVVVTGGPVDITGVSGVNISAYSDITINATSSFVFVAASGMLLNSVPIATVDYVQANPVSTDYLLTGIKIGSLTYAIPSQSGQGQYVPYSGAVSDVDLGSHALTLTNSNSYWSGSAVTTIHGYGISINTNGNANGVDVEGANAHIRLYNGSSVYAELAHDDGGQVVIQYSDYGSYYTYRFPKATGTIALQEYVDNRHTMYNTDSLSDANIDRILIAGGVVILKDSSPLLDLSLAMTPTLINNNQGLNLSPNNSINNINSLGDRGLSLTIENSIN